MTFSDSFERSKGFLRATLQAPADGIEPATPTPRSASPRRPRRGLLHTVKKIGHVLKKGATPSRFRRTSEQEKIADERNRRCLGISLVPMVDVQNSQSGKLKGLKRKQCVLCNICTTMYCTGCNRYFCVNKDRMKQLVARGHISPEEAKKLCTMPHTV